MRHLKGYVDFVSESKEEDLDTVPASELEPGMEIDVPHGFAKIDGVNTTTSSTTIRYKTGDFKGEWTYENDEELKVKNKKDDDEDYAEEDMEQ